ncbi:MAG TPA: HD domain-containing phosphohydrolase, partial [Candidatus Dormibacteraeota bacterium]|nr:HD domain-containing phosphohydrolase [Candidatus Dormibacteraeota bacterium]
MRGGTRVVALLLCAGAALAVLELSREWPHRLAFDPIAGVLLVVVSVTAHSLRVKTGPRTNLDLSNAAAFAAVLLLPPAAAVMVSGLGVLLFDAVPRRVVVEGPRRLRPWETAFNVSQTMLATAVSAWVYYRFVPADSPAPLVLPQDVLAIPLAAAAGLLCNILLVTAMVSIQLHVNPARIAQLMIKLDLVQLVATYVAALVTAICAANWPWAVLLLVFLAVLINISMRRVLLRFEDTVRAVEAMADVVDTRDPFTFSHSRRVAEYATSLCRQFRIEDEEAAAIRLAARVHDLGKIGIPDHVLFKPGKLTDGERR